MNIPEEFGKYLLLKKLTEDPLGETFRAGRVGKEGMEQVVLLRVFNGKGVDGEKLWQRASGRAGVQQALKSPNIGSGIDLGRVRSFPYAAYDYISGKNLASLAAAAAPADVPYLYFVSRNDGTHVFASNLQEHNRNVELWQRQYWRDRRARDRRR